MPARQEKALPDGIKSEAIQKNACYKAGVSLAITSNPILTMTKPAENKVAAHFRSILRTPQSDSRMEGYGIISLPLSSSTSAA